MPLLQINANASTEVKAVIRVMLSLPKDIAKNVRAANKAVIGPLWKEAVRGNALTSLEVLVLADTARVAITDKNVTLQSAGIGRPLKGGGTPPELMAGTEFGSTEYKQFKRRRKAGYVVYAAAAEVIPRIAALWIQTTIRTVHEAFEGR